MGNIGIDLGTTHSLVATVISGEARCLLDDDERALLPSAVVYSNSGVLVGIGAAAITDEIIRDPSKKVFTSVKRFMGRSPQDVAEEAHLFQYQLAEDPRVVRFKIAPKEIIEAVEHPKIPSLFAPKSEVTPIEISALILKNLANRAEECLLSEPDGAVVTVPAYFDDAQRQATKDAARLAGIEVLRLLNEPTAAALAYGLQNEQDGRKVVIYDLGGGTFDVSLLELHDGVFEVKSTAGDTKLGGDDFDQALAKVLLTQVGISELDEVTFRKAVKAAEQAKKELSSQESTTIDVELQGKRVEAGISRRDFEKLIAPIVARTGACCKQALQDAKWDISDIEEVVLVGGSTRVPLVCSYVEDFFGLQPHSDLNPDQVVALGAAIQADILSGESEIADDLLLLDILPLSLGLEVMGGVVERLIPRCSSIPIRESKRFTTHVDGQTSMKIHVVQGEREMVKDNRSLAQFSLHNLPALQAGVPRIKVTLAVDANGLLRVSAEEEFSGTQASIEVSPSYGLLDEEIEQMLDDAIDNAEQDVEERLLIESQIEAEQVLQALTKSIEADANLATADELQVMKQVSEDLQKAIDAKERRKISGLTHKLDEVSAPFAQRRIERDLGLALKGRSTKIVAEELGLDKS
jgi:molecular chaperone HscA